MTPTTAPIAESNRIALGDVLDLAQANLRTLYDNTKQAHWNVQGPTFAGLHLLFEEIATVASSEMHFIVCPRCCYSQPDPAPPPRSSPPYLSASYAKFSSLLALSTSRWMSSAGTPAGSSRVLSACMHP